ncbi:MAG: hypothetical protein NZ533_07905 [Casimicrobiaceae bacterium]|nr:hypothetical protein [Casimicrobiaceae bacterium]MCX8098150.1 hypothetical protein [Casimicrobiaceae bacterium]MDW8313168.1 hypothetical protein [Burkholderiales bacterium]
MNLAACLRSQGIDWAIRRGLQALGANSHRILLVRGARAMHSVDLDSACKEAHPNEPRWDYGVEWRRHHYDEVAWIEVHPATSGEVEAFLLKLKWLKARLRDAAGPCDAIPSTFHWVATDAGVHIDSARLRKLNAAGIRKPRRRLEL